MEKLIVNRKIFINIIKQNFLKIKFKSSINLQHNNNFFFKLLNLNFFFFIQTSNNRIISLNKIYINYFNLIILIINKYKTFYLKTDELELKGINYWFCKLKTNLLLDLGCSHFQLFYYPINYLFLILKKKKHKRIVFFNFNNYYFSFVINFFWYKLRSIGPYKLKGFQFINERIKLKQGKKPFK